MWKCEKKFKFNLSLHFAPLFKTKSCHWTNIIKKIEKISIREVVTTFEKYVKKMWNNNKALKTQP